MDFYKTTTCDGCGKEKDISSLKIPSVTRIKDFCDDSCEAKYKDKIYNIKNNLIMHDCCSKEIIVTALNKLKEKILDDLSVEYKKNTNGLMWAEVKEVLDKRFGF